MRGRLMAVAAAGVVMFVLGLVFPEWVGVPLKLGVLTVAVAAGLVASVGAARRTRGRTRAGWVMGAVYAGLMVVVFPGSLLDYLGYKQFAVLGALGMLAIVAQMTQLALLLPTAGSIWAKLARLADIAAVTAALSGVAWHFVLVPIRPSLSGELLAGVISYEMLLTAGAAWAMVSLAGTDPRRHGYVPHLLGSAMTLETVSGLMSLRYFLGSSTLLSAIGAAVSLVGTLLIVLAAHHAEQRKAERRRSIRLQSYRWLVLPYVPVVLSFVVVVVVAVLVGAQSLLLTWVLVVTTAMAIVRQFLSLVIIAGLTSRLDRQANQDALTRLPNRPAFEARAAGTFADAGPGDLTGLLLIDLDGFKQVNDTLGHATGDRLLIEAGKEMADLVAGRGVAARLGGDEFVVLLPHMEHADQADDIASGVVSRVGRLAAVLGIATPVGASVGVAVAAGTGHDVATVLARADAALYAAKAAGKNTYRRESPQPVRPLRTGPPPTW